MHRPPCSPSPSLTAILLSAFALLSGASAYSVEVNQAGLSFFQPLPEVAAAPENPVTEAKVELGSKLFHDPRFSRSQSISCNSCHGLSNYGVDGTPNSKGHRDKRGDRNAPTVFNAALHLSQFWDGRAPTVEEQAKGPVLNPIEMAMPDADHVVKVIKSIPDYPKLFAKAFPEAKDPVTYDNFGRAIGAFERKLLTPARWDEFLRGQGSALTDAEKHGFNKFTEAGCVTCHNGPAVGGALYQKLGLLKPWPGLKDEGRAKATKNDAEKGFFKVPSLRNITKTGPYLHDGSVSDLPTMVRMMAEHQAGRKLSEADVKSIVTFLEALTGKLPEKLIAQPELPKSGPDTPKADAGE
ncbi:cytochrome-c peroxidase [Verrucomicrobiaceae bacterium SCGC AG-212-N21]|nr:cytochrome-c peroxidase [Verrucomicrobiaceae bacterium SCGC AG-212-N21]